MGDQKKVLFRFFADQSTQPMGTAMARAVTRAVSSPSWSRIPKGERDGNSEQKASIDRASPTRTAGLALTSGPWPARSGAAWFRSFAPGTSPVLKFMLSRTSQFRTGAPSGTS